MSAIGRELAVREHELRVHELRVDLAYEISKLTAELAAIATGVHGGKFVAASLIRPRMLDVLDLLARVSERERFVLPADEST